MMISLCRGLEEKICGFALRLSGSRPFSFCVEILCGSTVVSRHVF